MPETQGERREEGSGFLRTALQSIGIFLLVQVVSRQFLGGGSKQDASSPVATSESAFDARPASMDEGATYSRIPNSILPMWPVDTTLDISMYISPSLIMPSLKDMPMESLIVDEKSIVLGDFQDNRVIEKTFAVPEAVQNNGTLWGHIYVAQSGYPLDPTAQNYDSSKAFLFHRPMTHYLMKKKVSKTRNLLAGAEEKEKGEQVTPATNSGPSLASYYHPNLTLSFIPDSGVQKFPQMHPALRQFVQLERGGARDSTGQNGWYYPIVYVNTFWQLRSQMTELNNTVKNLPIYINVNNMKNWKFSIMASVDEGMKETARKAAAGEAGPGGGDGSEMEEIKRVLLESNVYLLGTTGVVTILHMIFEMLAFKNDVAHWRKKKDNVGTSLRTILANIVMQAVIFLYLMDNNENTSWMILFGQGMGIAIEAWKITKTVNVRVRPTAPGALLPYTIAFEDKHKLSDTEQKTKEYDEIAFKYLYMIAVPLLIAYAVYSIVYDTHKSWYSFTITTLVGAVYAYGFLLMVPSLYINYRLGSVAHMPGKAMMYKFLNTFIDDLFAFTIKMPMLHRLATLRDDVIFFIYLYQSYKYKVDYSRVNEFGQGGEDGEDEAKTKEKKAGESDKEHRITNGTAYDATDTDDPAKALKASGKSSQGKSRKRK